MKISRRANSRLVRSTGWPLKCSVRPTRSRRMPRCSSTVSLTLACLRRSPSLRSSSTIRIFILASGCDRRLPAVHEARCRSVGHRRLFCAALIATAALPAGGAQAATPAAASSYHMIAQYPIGGNDTGYDYLRVDALTRRVFVAHANRVEVLNVDTGEKLGEIAGMHGVHGIELIAELGKGYTSNGLDRTVTVFDRDTLKIRKVIRYTGVKPDAIQYDPQTRRLFVVNGGASGDVTVSDPVSDAIVDTLDLGGSKLEQIGFDGRGRAFVNDEGKSVIHVFDTHSLQPVANWSLGGGEEPTGMAVDRRQ